MDSFDKKYNELMSQMFESSPQLNESDGEKKKNESVECPSCDGKGMTKQDIRDSSGEWYKDYDQCRECGGTGRIPKEYSPDY